MSNPIYLNLQEVASSLSLSVSSIQNLTRKDSTFPKSRLLSGRRVAWLHRELVTWAESRPISVLPPPSNTGAKKPKKKLQAIQDNQIAA